MIVFALYLIGILLVLAVCGLAADLWLRYIDDPLAEPVGRLEDATAREGTGF